MEPADYPTKPSMYPRDLLSVYPKDHLFTFIHEMGAVLAPEGGCIFLQSTR